MRLGLLIPYFGKAPAWSEYFLRTVAANRNLVDFHLFHDDEAWTVRKYDNVFFHKTTFAGFSEDLRRRLGTHHPIQAPYKLVDYKPTYGHAFPEILAPYDFWGYGDVDVIWGDLKQFITLDRLKSFDKIFELGHLSFVRNTPELNRLYLSSEADVTFAEAAARPDAMCFDEYHGFMKIIAKHKVKVYKGARSREHIADLEKYTTGLRVVPPEPNHKYQTFLWEDNKLHRLYSESSKAAPSLEEFAYVHFQKRGMTPAKPFQDDITSFWITHRGIFPRDDCKGPRDFRHHATLTVADHLHQAKRWALPAVYKVGRKLGLTQKKARPRL